MAENVAPGFVRISYHSAFGFHSMSIPTLQWINDDFPSGKFQNWSIGEVEADVMINDLVDTFEALFPTSVEFDNYTIFTVSEEEGADPLPQYAANLTQVGTDATPGWFKAAQITLTARTTLFGLAKLTFLDVATHDVWDKATAPDTDYAAVFDEWSDPTNGWSGRDNGRPNVFLQTSATLNEALRKSYRMN